MKHPARNLSGHRREIIVINMIFKDSGKQQIIFVEGHFEPGEPSDCKNWFRIMKSAVIPPRMYSLHQIYS